MIIDAFLFNNELDLLEMRLEELSPVVDLFILVQADKTFRGNPKPFYFDKEDPRWRPYYHQIRDFRGTWPMGSTWDREIAQRNSLSEIIKSEAYYEPDAICIVSDVDEIPRRNVVSVLPMRTNDLDRFPASLGMDLFYYSLNVKAGTWGGAKVCLADDLTTAQELRHDPTVWTIPDAGWHFSYLGDDDFISNKLRSFSHSELDIAAVHARIPYNRERLLDPFNHGEKLQVVEIDDTWPEAVKNNPEKWERYVWQG